MHVARRPDGDRPGQGALRLNVAVLAAAVAVLALLVCLALVSWFGRLS